MIISMEGPDAAGKSTQVELLKNNLIEKGYKIKVFHFPRYENPIGELIGKVLTTDVKVDFTALQMLYVADQIDFQNDLNNYLKEGYIVLLDRYDLSTMAYYISKTKVPTIVGMGSIRNWQEFLRKPELTFIFNSKCDSITERREENTLDKFEKDKDITVNINTVYEKISSTLCDRRVSVIDSSKSIKEIEEHIKNLTLLYLEGDNYD